MSKKKYDPGDAIKLMERKLAALDILILRDRECRKAGEHRYEEGKADDRCTRCYIPVKKYAKVNEEIQKEIQNLLVMNQPCDAPVMMERAKREISDLKRYDLDNRIALLEKEKKGKVK
jgi:hypothetical protein